MNSSKRILLFFDLGDSTAQPVASRSLQAPNTPLVPRFVLNDGTGGQANETLFNYWDAYSYSVIKVVV